VQGTQTLPLSFLGDPKQAYTYPDANDNKLVFIAAKGSRFLSDHMLLGGNAYYRHYKTSNFSSNVNDDFGAADPGTGEVDDDPAHNDRSTIDQKGWGSASRSRGRASSRA
jgi:hypothetical protein